jgi:hypothetical protein
MTTEAALQIGIVRWLHDVLPDTACVHHSPNEGRRKPHYGMKLKALGLRAGWPDLEIFVPEDEFVCPDQANAIFLEVKTPRGVLSEAQRACHSELLACGVHLSTVRGIDDCKAFLAGLVTLRQPTPHARAIEQQLRA